MAARLVLTALSCAALAAGAASAPESRGGRAQGPSVSATQKPPCPSYIQCPYPPYPRPTTKPPPPPEAPVTPEPAGPPPDGPLAEYFGLDRSSETPAASTDAAEATSQPSANTPVASSSKATQKPPCPSFIQCPYPEYPRPTTKATTEVDNVTPAPNNTAQNPVVEYFLESEKNNASEPASETPSPLNKPVSGPSISATQKPPCPSYIQCPYPEYPRPTTKATTEVDNVTPAPNNTAQNPVVEYFLESEKNNASEPASETPSPLNRPVSGPSISATQKPPCPSYIQCPYPEYPRPTTKGTTEVDNVTPAPNNTAQNPVVEDVLESEKNNASEATSETPLPLNRPVRGLSISATQKPPCPSFIQCPYPEYPRPTTKGTTEVDNVTPAPNKPLIEYFFGPESPNYSKPTIGAESTQSSPNLEADRVSKPAVSATQKPPCPSYIQCPYPEYPRPTTKSTTESENTTPPITSQTESPLVEYFGSDNYDQSSEKENNNMDNSLPVTTTLKNQLELTTNMDESSKSPSIIIKPHTEYPSYLPGPWVYPRPTTTNPVLDINPTTQAPVGEYFASSNVHDLGSSSPSSTNKLSAQGFHFPGPTKGKPSISSSRPTETASLLEYFGPETGSSYYNVQTPPSQEPVCPPYISCPYEYPKPPSNKLKISEYSAGTLSNRNPSNMGGSTIIPTAQNLIDLANQGMYLPIYSYLYGINNYNYGGTYNKNKKRPSISLTPRPFWPSYLTNPWIYPQPFGNDDGTNWVNDRERTG